MFDIRNFKNNKKSPSEKSEGDFNFAMKATRIFSVIALIFASATVFTLIAMSMVNDCISLYKPYKKATLQVGNLEELCEKLEEKGIIKYGFLFESYAEMQGKTDIKRKNEAVFVDSKMDYREILRRFQEKDMPLTVRIKFERGITTDEIIDTFVKSGIGSRAQFEKVINTYPFDYDFVRELDGKNLEKHRFRLDGYLYPDTYDFYTGRSEAYYIYKMLDRFDYIVKTEIKELAKEKNMSISDAVIMASMIQRSAQNVSGYEYVSAVFHNRLRNNEYLNCPACCDFSGGIYVGDATEEIKKADSLYNTFLHKGLPKGAICSPDKNAIICALKPAVCAYTYYVTDFDGYVLFAESEREHLKNLEKIKS